MRAACTRARTRGTYNIWGLLSDSCSAAQPNNFNGGEDCMVRTNFGYADNVCTEVHPCLCEWPSTTSAEYLHVHAPALIQRGDEAFELMKAKATLFFAVALVVASLPALCFALFVEVYFIRWKLRTAPSTPQEASLQASQRLALRRRILQSGLLLWLGCSLLALAYVPERLVNEASWPYYGFAIRDQDAPWGKSPYWEALYMPGIALAALSLLPTDSAAIRLTALGWTIFNMLDFSLFRFTGRFGSWPHATAPPFKTEQIAFMWIWIILRAVAALAALPGSVFWGRRRLPGRLALRWLWISIRATGVIKAADLLNIGAFWIALGPWAAMGWAGVHKGLVTLCVSLLLTPTVRRRIQRMFADLWRGAGEASAAVAIASMVGGDPIAAIRNAQERLRVIRISQLTEGDMANNQDSGLYQKTEHVQMGEVDAFLSHSWRDDSALKWQRFCEFKAEFAESNGGAEPRCWLDKACIDQDGDINGALKALPIYLLASQCFSIFAGRSYTRRLWCVLEVFTFMRAGGSYKRIDVRPLDLDATEAVTLFDIRKAECYLAADKHALLAVVESSYGSFERFNTACRKILLAKLGSGKTDAELAADEKIKTSSKAAVAPSQLFSSSVTV